jgi:hypothetical protein
MLGAAHRLSGALAVKHTFGRSFSNCSKPNGLSPVLTLADGGTWARYSPAIPLVNCSANTAPEKPPEAQGGPAGGSSQECEWTRFWAAALFCGGPGRRFGRRGPLQVTRPTPHNSAAGDRHSRSRVASSGGCAGETGRGGKAFEPPNLAAMASKRRRSSDARRGGHRGSRRNRRPDPAAPNQAAGSARRTLAARRPRSP